MPHPVGAALSPGVRDCCWEIQLVKTAPFSWLDESVQYSGFNNLEEPLDGAWIWTSRQKARRVNELQTRVSGTRVRVPSADLAYVVSQ